MGFVPQQEENMKTTIALLTALAGFATLTNVKAGDTASCCADKAAALSPRAQANQTVVVSGKADADFVRADLGFGARSKASGGYSGNLATAGAKDVDLTRDRSLGAAAKAKATGTSGSATIQIAPLK